MKKILTRENNKQALSSGLIAVLVFLPVILVIKVVTGTSIDSWPWWGQFFLYFAFGMVTVQVVQSRAKKQAGK
ncbi:hypothetical protein [Fructobacillus parabroussonetiae]|uniref:Uncharacterized protein n=1 Tax=Fructobacillus parabroussonetiae TaxID=2713174 RepID=A0ABS5QX33_9LACO|nr:hypothetical protein [Fructobacillus parabroussonetiae]MBS9336916.1 hypothetical protein [Fructobacillus parabroussonetiae]